MANKPDAWDATAKLDDRISTMLAQISEQYGVRIKTDSDYSKGTIKIKVTDK